MTATTLPSGTGIVSTYTYDNADRLTNIAHVKGGSTTVASVHYEAECHDADFVDKTAEWVSDRAIGCLVGAVTQIKNIKQAEDKRKAIAIAGVACVAVGMTGDAPDEAVDYWDNPTLN